MIQKISNVTEKEKARKIRSNDINWVTKMRNTEKNMKIWARREI